MPVTLRHLQQTEIPQDSRNTTIDENGLYQAIDRIIEQAHQTIELSIDSKLWNLRKRLWYFAYTDTKLSQMGDAIEAWKNYRNSSNIRLPIGLEDELTFIFYIFLYHENPEIKEKNIREILTQLGVQSIPNSLIQLCNQKPLERRLYPEEWPDFSKS